MKLRRTTWKLLLAALALPSLFVTRAYAITTTWTGGAGNGLWGDAGNWSTGVPGSTDTAQFAGAGSSINLGAIARPVRTISTSGAGWTFGNGTFTSLQTVNALDSTTINANVVGNVVLGLAGNLLVNGEISGTAILEATGATFTAANIYTSRTRAFDLRLSGLGAAPNSWLFSAIGSGGGLTLDYGPVVVDKIGDLNSVQTINSTLHVHNSGNSPASETIGLFGVAGTANTIRIDSAGGSAAPMTLTAPILLRGNRTTALIDVDPSTGGRLMLGEAPPTAGLIIPWAIGVRNGVPSFVTYDNVLGVRPLDLATEYASAISPGVSIDNVRLTSPQSLNVDAYIDSLALYGAGLQLGSGAQLSVSRGAISLAAPATPGIVDSITGPGRLVPNFEAVLHVGASPTDTNTYRISAPISASVLIKTGAATLIFANVNAIPGDIYVNEGTLVSTVAGGLGNGVETIHIGVNSALNIKGVSQTYGTLSPDASLQDTSGFTTFRTAHLGIDDGITATFAHLAGAGELLMHGDGTLRITGDSPINNGIEIEAHAGVIQIDGTIRPFNPGGSQDTLTSIQGFDNAIVSGSGSILGSVLGNVEPGSGVDDAGRLTINRLSSFNGGRIGIDIAGNVAGDDYDQLVVMLLAALTNRTLDVDLLNGFTPALGTQFTILDNQFAGAIFGTFAGLPQDSLLFADGQAFQINYLGGDGNDVVLTTVVPEPSSLIFVFAPLAAIAFSGSRRRRVC